jgi:hypothetical protein
MESRHQPTIKDGVSKSARPLSQQAWVAEHVGVVGLAIVCHDDTETGTLEAPRLAEV